MLAYLLNLMSHPPYEEKVGIRCDYPWCRRDSRYVLHALYEAGSYGKELGLTDEFDFFSCEKNKHQEFARKAVFAWCATPILLKITELPTLEKGKTKWEMLKERWSTWLRLGVRARG